MSRVKCKKEEMSPIFKLRFDFAMKREKNKLMVQRINDRLRRLYGFHQRVL